LWSAFEAGYQKRKVLYADTQALWSAFEAGYQKRKVLYASCAPVGKRCRPPTRRLILPDMQALWFAFEEMLWALKLADV
jgi:hypothetical protein